ncbi:UBC-like protein [Sporormia fimetaria CBS 119925]|uniref:UBC-like protein n=1 Tax=Sporormia fimetaria CBS 119925 TaxID=1340428 RepID=A0A6A6VDI6_9PLEO|nr:UBC-like protein [Sporormia fimetaria CBS 119925]
MNSKSLRRLAADHSSLHTAGLPPNYLFPPTGTSDPLADLTSLDVLLAGPTGTPYSAGLWRLHLDIPPTYPNAPPTATFRTRLWHPNIDEASGAVCVETLKRDWSSSLKLRDVLVTISCLLIQPNPASALNEEAGKLANEDWEGYCRRARLMTEIHAGVPEELGVAVREAQRRGEDDDDVVEREEVAREVVGMGVAEGKEKVAVLEAVSEATVGKGKEAVVQVEDEENRDKREETMELESDDESDWIPGPMSRSPNLFNGGMRKTNIFGIQGLDKTRPFGTGLQQRSSRSTSPLYAKELHSDPFTTPSQPPQNHSFSLRVPPPPPSSSTLAASQLDSSFLSPPLPQPQHETHQQQQQQQQQQQPTTTNPDTRNRLLTEFSWKWEDTQTLYDMGDPCGLTKSDVRKRFASNEYEKRRDWEMKKFKAVGWSLGMYNRGAFWPRVGEKRL